MKHLGNHWLQLSVLSLYSKDWTKIKKALFNVRARACQCQGELIWNITSCKILDKPARLIIRSLFGFASDLTNSTNLQIVRQNTVWTKVTKMHRRWRIWASKTFRLKHRKLNRKQRACWKSGGLAKWVDTRSRGRAGGASSALGWESC